FVLVFALGNLIQIPGWVFLAAAVLALGRTWGGVATYVAACVSCVSSFLIVRFVGGDALRQLDNRFVARILARLDSHPVRSIFVARVLFQTLPALNYALAMSGIRFRAYLLGTLLGLPLPIAGYCLFFDYLARALHLT
ncbi:MAG: VTT domain-containing protein, partial [Gammaproteobacteria bacterium]|nr:VTT domain-containing protein [Gammaproteobacteria bacterium]